MAAAVSPVRGLLVFQAERGQLLAELVDIHSELARGKPLALALFVGVALLALGDDVGGIAVNIGARIGAEAMAGEVLVSSTVRELVVGSGLEFADRGVRELKGVPGEWRLFAIA